MLDMKTWIMNSIGHMGYIPQLFKKGLLVPIPKAKKDATIKNNNRGITLISVLFKIFEKIIIDRHSSWLDQTMNNDEIQSCGKKKVSCLHSSFIVQETVAHNVNGGNTVYATFLDTQKAFDTVWIEGLLYKLLKSGVNTKLWQLIKCAYTNFECAVVVAGDRGNWFSPKRGVHQGAPLSMYLYTVFINDLLRQLKLSGHGISIGHTITTCPTHADDVAILALFKTGLNALLKIAYEYSTKWRYTFNTSKTVLMIWGKDRQSDISVTFGTELLQPSKSCTHMGVSLFTETKLENEFYKQKSGAAKGIIYSAKSLGNDNLSVPPKTLSRIYWSVAIPKMLYGLDITPVNDNCMIYLESAYR